ncbi:haloacid dehalogenase [Aerococcus urinaehominis]|uniref:Haloacid dehalogenase n=1 Tax=Aerococcus urinaehominis TaxID=128944 RepID=A0A109RGV1_9LACT|nr:Cof-type HAD-IIB family hydrolase [Aerococcus urinaehominis]AMB98961.1 haloacid dehalogenase [Aerococcus urinaehominis]SDM36900.1 hypothetical protein SAMN04487985_1145 [Aerococcus urinaehominis]
MIKLIAIDLDGTLLTDDKQISARNVASISQAIDQGVHVVITTGRPIEAIQAFNQILGTDNDAHYSVTYNGGLVLNNGSKDVIADRHLTKDQVQAIYQACHELDLPLVAVGLDQVYAFPDPLAYPSNYHKTMPFLPFNEQDPTSLTSQDLVFKCVVATDSDHLAQQLPKLDSELLAGLSVMRSHPHQLEFMPLGIDKAYGLARLAERLDLTADQVMAIGDEENDLAMLQWAGEAVVMANGRDDIKAYATYITGSNMADGVAQAIDHFVLN